MKKLFKSRKVLLWGVFAFVIIAVAAVNIALFSGALKLTSASKDTVQSVADSTKLEYDNREEGNVISEKKAIEKAEAGVKEMDVWISDDWDWEKATADAKYVYKNSVLPYDDPIWVVVFMNKHGEYTFQYPPEVKAEEISEIAWDKGLVWKDENGKIFARYEDYNEYIVAEVDAVTGELRSRENDASVNAFEKEEFQLSLKAKYNVDFEL